jgi:gliding motility-associated-like protein
MKYLKILFVIFCALFFNSNAIISQSDGCSAATVLPVTSNCSSPTAGTTAGATQTIPGCVGNADDDVWYQFTATSTTHQVTVVGSSSFDAVVQLFSGGCSSLSTISCMDQSFNGGTETIYATGLTVGAVYRIRVYHYFAGSGSSTFTICVTTPPAPPANDNCSGSTLLSVNTTCTYVAGTSASATQSLPGCAGNADDDVWFRFVATNSVQTINVQSSGSFDAVVQLYAGTCASLTSLYCRDNTFTGGLETINAVGLIPGNTYYIRVYDYYTATGGGPFQICVEGPASAAPVNDEPCNAIALPPVTAECSFLNFTTVGATASTGAPTPFSCVGGSAPQQGGFNATTQDVWFSVVVPSSGVISITAQPSFGINDAVMALYSGTCGSLTQIACSDDHNYPGTTNDFKPFILQTGLTPGATLFIRYWRFNTGGDQFGICVSSPTNDDCADALYICDINGYSASTNAAYTTDRPCNMRANAEQNNPPTYTYTPGTCQPGGIFGLGGAWGVGAPACDVRLDNNSWIEFTAATSTVVLQVTVTSCFVGNYPSGGIQMQIFSGTNCCSFAPVSDFREGSGTFTITANSLTVGQNYYLLVDGYAGDICNYTINALSGVAFPEIDASANPVCAGTSVTLTAPAGATSYLWSPGGQTTPTIVVSPSTTTTYSVIVEGVCGYKQTLTKQITVNQLPTLTTSSTATRCSGQNFTTALTADLTSTYSWSAANNPNTTGETTTNQTSSTINNTITNSTTSPQTVIYTIVPTSSQGCVGPPQTISLTVNPLPTMTSANSATICSGATLSIPLTSNLASTYSWIATSNTNVNGESLTAQSSSTINNTLTSTVTSVQTVNYTVTPTTTPQGCAGSAQAVNVTVNPTPTMTSATSAAICSGGTLNIPLTSSVASNYSWIATDNTNVSGESLTAQSTSTINNTLTTASTSPQTVNYSVTPTSTVGSCGGSAQSVTVTVNPTPVMTSVTSGTTCSGQALNIPLTSSVASSYSWIAANNPNTTGESLTAQLGSTINNTITNATSSPEVVNYTVTPTSTIGSCPGTGQSVAVTVNPLPTMTSANSATICSGATLNIPLTSNLASTYSWIATSNTNVNGESLTAQSSSTINNTLTSTVTSVQTVNYTVTPTTTPQGCAGSAQAVNVTVNPTPTMTSATSAAICSGGTLNIPLTSSVASNYSWIATDNTNVSGESLTAQSTSTINNTLTTASTSPQTVNYSVTPTSTIGSCGGSAQSVTVTVNNLPILAVTPSITPSDCGLATGAITGATVNGNPTLNYSWTNTSSVVVGTTLDLTNQPAGDYTLSVTDGNLCSSQFGPFAITNPSAPLAPTISGNPVSVCEGGSFTLTASSGAPSPTFNWTLANGSNSTGSTVVINPAQLTDGGAYSVTVTSSSCVSPAATVSVIVNATPAMSSPNSAAICSGETVNIPLTAAVPSTFTWIAIDNTNVTGESTTSQTTALINNTLNNTSTTNQNVVYTVTPTATAGGCVGSGQLVTVTVNTLPDMTVTPSSSPSDCGLATGAITGATVNGNPTLNYSWTNTSSVVVGTTLDLTNQPAGDYTLSVTDGNLCSSQFGPYTITNPNSPTVPAPSVVDATCIDLNGSISIGGGFDLYELTGVNPIVTNVSNATGIFTNITPGQYSIVVTDVTNCVSSPLLVNVVNDDLLDCDGDGVTNGDEAADGTNPYDPCDFDPNSITLPQSGDWNDADCDGDGVTNEDEVADGTDPNDPCSYEIGSVTLTPGGDWNTADCDGDGVTNEDEVADGTDPLDPCAYLEGSITLPQTGEWLEADCDGDGVTNEDEVADGTDPNDPCSFELGSITLTPGGDWNDADCDGDGVTNEDEVADGTDPNDPCSYEIGSITLTPGGDWNTADCDGDGVTNEDEVADGTDPLDPCAYLEGSITLPQTGEWLEADCDGDGVTNEDEVADGTDPNDPCSFELGSITLTPGGDWNDADCDGDGVTNEDEVADGTDPNDPCSYEIGSITLTPGGDWNTADCDGDGVTNEDEVADGTDPLDPCAYLEGSITLPQTGEWLEADCDGDGVTNEDEVADGTDPNDPCSFELGSITLTPGGDWNDADCDGDGVTNEDELTDGTDPYDPCDYVLTSQTLTPSPEWEAIDCDGDGVTNGDELVDGTNPQDPCSFVAASITLTVSVECLGDLVVIIPTIFTPNGDGSNDIFYPTVVNALAMQASIYNRWGQLIYEWDGTAGGWDGRTVAGVESSEATYFYLFYITDKDNAVHEYQGHFALKR